MLSNAIRYTDDGGHVVTTVSIDDTDAVISVSDDGMGIAPEDIPRILLLILACRRSRGIRRSWRRFGNHKRDYGPS